MRLRRFQVLQRCCATLIPTTSTNYVANYLSPAPDLYGPFWTLTTVVFALFVFSSLASSIAAYLSDPNVEYNYNFQLLSIAVSLVYGELFYDLFKETNSDMLKAYGLGLPALLWATLRYLGVTEWSLVEAVAVWGYGQFIWIPVAVRHFSVLESPNVAEVFCLGALHHSCSTLPLGSCWRGLRTFRLFPRGERIPDSRHSGSKGDTPTCHHHCPSARRPCVDIQSTLLFILHCQGDWNRGPDWR